MDKNQKWRPPEREPIRLEPSIGGDAKEMVPLLYKELRALAHALLRKEKGASTLHTTALVNEVYLKLAGSKKLTWNDRDHFLAIAATVMRHVLVDYFREKRAQKRGRGVKPDALAGSSEIAWEGIPLDGRLDLLALDEAMKGLAKQDERKCRIVEMRFFGGLESDDIAKVLGISPISVRREWRIARAWLFREINKGEARES